MDRVAALARRLLNGATAILTLRVHGQPQVLGTAGWSISISEGQPDEWIRLCLLPCDEARVVSLEDLTDAGPSKEASRAAALGFGAFLGVPLLDREGACVGSLGVLDHDPREWTRSDIELMRELAETAADAIDREIRIETTRLEIRDLEETARLLRGTLSSLDVAVFVVESSDRTIVECNDAALDMFGYTRKQLLGRGTLDIHVDEAHSRNFGEWSGDVLETGEVFRGEYIMRRADGTTFPTRHVVAYLDAEAGPRSGVVSVVRDMTEEFEAKRKLEVSEARFRAVAECAPDAILTIDFEYRIVYANPAAHQIFGYSGGELVGLSMTELVPADQLGKHMARIRRSDPPSERYSGIEIPAVRANGTPFVVEITFAEYEIEDSRYFTGIARDVTERNAIAASLQETEARFRQIAESIDSVFWITNPDRSRMEYLSPAYGRVWGRPPEDLLSNPQKWMEAVHPDDRNRVEQALTGQSEGLYAEEYRILRPSGEIRWVYERTFLVRDKDGAVNRIIGVAEDITDEKRLEEQLLQSQKMEAIGRLAGGVAHDFNNLLTVIQGHSQLAMDALPEGSSVRHDLSSILDEVDRAGSLTRQLLAFSRRQVLSNEVFDLSSLLSEMEPMLTRLLPERIGLRFELDEACLVKADPNQLRQVIMNLALNARDAIQGHGAVSFGVEVYPLTEEEAIRVPWEIEPGDYVQLTIEDTGVGMPPHVLSRIFEPFFTTKPSGEGTGLGLSMVFGIMKQSGGHILVESEPGGGALFRLLLPKATGDVTDSRLVEGKPVWLGAEPAGQTVLLVEDEPGLLSVIRRILIRAGYAVIAAENGEEALELVRRHRDEIDVVLSDVVMPGMDGGELADKIHRFHPTLKLILMSGYVEEDVPGAVRGKGTPFLEKPFSPDELVRVIREHLNA